MKKLFSMLFSMRFCMREVNAFRSKNMFGIGGIGGGMFSPLRNILFAAVCLAAASPVAAQTLTLPEVKFVESGLIRSTATSSLLAEAGNHSVSKIERSGGDMSNPLQVAYTLSGTATPGVDYRVPAEPVVIIPANEASVQLQLTPIQDNFYDHGETIIITLNENPAVYTRVMPFVHTIGFIDDEDPALIPPASVRWVTQSPTSAELTWINLPAPSNAEHPTGVQVQIREKPADPNAAWSKNFDNVIPDGITANSTHPHFRETGPDGQFNQPPNRYADNDPDTNVPYTIAETHLRMTDITFAGLTDGVEYQLRMRSVAFQPTAHSGWTHAVEQEAAPLSTDASLSALVLSDAGGEVMLSPEFAAGVFSYDAQVPFQSETVTVTPTVTEFGRATVKVNTVTVDAGASSDAIDIAIGAAATVISVVVTAEDTNTMQTYELHVTRAAPSTDATLRALLVKDEGLNDLTLAPASAADSTRTFRANVLFAVDKVSVTPTANDEFASITVNTDAVESGLQSGLIDLSVIGGDGNEILTIVTAESGATQTYTLIITRGEVSTDSTLSDLTVTTAETMQSDRTTITLMPEMFAADTLTYETSVEFETETVRVEPVKNNEFATLMINGGDGTARVISLDVGLNEVNIVVTAQNMMTRTYVVRITRIASRVATLSNLVLTHGDNVAITLTPTFMSNKDVYDAAVKFAVAAVRVTPTLTAADDGATVSVNAGAVESGAGADISLGGGGETKTIMIVVTAAAGNTMTYTLRVARGAASTDNNLRGLTVSAGTIDFMPATTEYTVNVLFAVQTITVTPTVNDAAATLQVQFEDHDSGTGKALSMPTPGRHQVFIDVTAESGANQRYTLTVIRGAASTVATLSDLTTTAGELTPAFTPATREYTASVAFGVTSATLTPTLTDTGLASVTVNGAEVNDGEASAAVMLDIGDNTISIVVTAEDFNVTQTYTLNIMRRDSEVATLSALAISGGNLAETFMPDTHDYTATVAYTVMSIKVMPTVTDTLRMATVKVNGDAVDSGGESADIPLTDGIANTISIVVTAAAGNTLTYTLAVTRTAASTIATLSNLETTAGNLSFAAATFTYSADVPFTTETVTVTPTVTDTGKAAVTVNGEDVTSGNASQAVSLNPGVVNEILIVITAQDTETTQTYTLNVMRGASNIATLDGLMLSGGTLDPVFAAETFSYSTNVPAAAANVTITPMATETGLATITIDADRDNADAAAVIDRMPSAALNLGEGVNIITLVVTAQDAETARTYTLELTRITSTAAELSALVISESGSELALSPVFAPAITNYAAQVPFATTEVTVTATAAATAGVEINGEETAEKTISLETGDTTIAIKVTGDDGSELPYAITVTRAESDIATLSGIALSAGALDPIFAEETFTYTASVSFDITEITVTPALSDDFATLSVNENPAGAPLPLDVGENEISIVVTAQNRNDMRTYMLTITRNESNVATLSKLEIPGVAFDSDFMAEKFTYTATVPFATDTVTVITKVTDTGKATATIGTAAAADDAASDPIPLTAGSGTDISITVTAADGETTKTYTVTLTRTAASTDATLTALTISYGMLEPAFFVPETLTYTAQVAFDVVMLTVTPAAGEFAVVTVDGVTINENAPAAVMLNAASTDTVINIVVTAEDGSAQTYTIIVSRDFDPSERTVLDVNSDGVTDSIDGTLIVRRLLGMFDAEFVRGLIDGINAVEINAIEQRIAAEVEAKTFDVNNDGEVTAADGIIISRWFLGVRGDGLIDSQADETPEMVEARITALLTMPATPATGAARLAMDVNSDAVITAEDGILIARYVLLGKTGDAEVDSRLAPEVAGKTLDANADGEITAVDGILIARFLLGVTEGDGLIDGQTDGQTGKTAADVMKKINALKMEPGVEQ